MKAMIRIGFRCGFAVVLMAAVLAGPTARAQGDLSAGDLSAELDVFPRLELGAIGSDSAADMPAKLSASYLRQSDTRGSVTVEARMQPKWHVYSLTQAAGGPTPTTIKLTGPDGVKLVGKFQPSKPPEVSTNEIWPGLPIEEHSERIRWTAEVEWPAGFSGELELTVNALACKTDGSCIPLNEKLTARLGSAGGTASPKNDPDAAAAPAAPPQLVADDNEADGETLFRNERSVVQWSGRVLPAEAAVGGRATLRLTAKPDETYHVYAAAVDDSESRTNIVVTDKAGLRLGMPQPPSAPIVKTILAGLPPVAFHEGEITWDIPIEIGADVAPGAKTIRGLVAYQACTDTSCLQPRALRFTARIDVTPMASEANTMRAVRFATAPYGETMDAAAETRWVDTLEAADSGEPDSGTQAAAPPIGDTSQPASPGESLGDGSRLASSPFSLIAILAMGLAGGVILNLMPCVLPVVGLKIMSFASQAGEDRGKVLALNVAYTLGILIVFWALAALAIVSTYSWGREFLGIEGQMSWGQQFQYFGFRYAVILLVFALALSFLGVWEIPLPGFVGGKSTQQLQQKEGFSGAFFKGIFTTLLATPCSGPLLGTVFAYTLGKSAWVIFAIFSSIGLGMAMPYLLIALFPPLIAFLPKPGAWMDTLKQLLGFLLLATVVFIFSFFPDDDRVLVFTSLIGVWFGCWVVGLVPNWQTLSKRLTAWAGGIGAAAAVCFFAFWATAAGPVVVAWEPYDEARLDQLRRQGRTVLIDFTAKWCVNCQVNYRVAINTEKTGRLVRELDAVAMLADWTDHSEEIRAKLQELDSNSIPVLAIYPGDAPDSPIILRDLVTQGEVLTALRAAGPSLAPGVANAGGIAGSSESTRRTPTADSEVVAWEPYDEVRLDQLHRQGRTVLIHFTAKWDVNSQVNYRVAINTEQTGRLVEELGAVAMLADWTDHSEVIRAKVRELDSYSIPVLAIYPGDDPDSPIILRDLVTQGEVLTALRAAGPSLAPGVANAGGIAGSSESTRRAPTADSEISSDRQVSERAVDRVNR